MNTITNTNFAARCTIPKNNYNNANSKPEKRELQVFDFVNKNKIAQPCRKKHNKIRKALAMTILINSLGLGALFGTKETTKASQTPDVISFNTIQNFASDSYTFQKIKEQEQIKTQIQETEFDRRIKAREQQARLDYQEYQKNEALKVFDVEIDLSSGQEKEVKKFLKVWNNYQDRYRTIEEVTDVPAELICAIHCRESGANFNKRLHDGGELGDFRSWEESAISALESVKKHAPKIVLGDYQTYLDFAEFYNGTGYRDYHNMNSPYIWAGTEKYSIGKYTQDGFIKDLQDQQVGVAVMLKTLYS